MPHNPAPTDDAYEFSFEAIGQSVKVTATDPDTGLEASLVAPEGVTQAELRREARAKLEYILKKRAEEGPQGSLF